MNYYQLKNINKFSLDEKLGQLLIIGFDGPVLTDETRSLIQKYKFGNFILFSRNIVNLEQLVRLTRDIHDEVIKSVGVMPFIAIDQEGGMVIRIKNKETCYPGSMTLAATDLENGKIVGHLMGKHLMALGINMNMAPSLDTNNNPKNPIIGVRSFSDNPDIVGKFGVSLIKGMQDEGIIATAKHFPGHGDVEMDSHLGLPVLPFNRQRLYDVELKPFKMAIANNVENIMCAHIIFKDIDPENPATLSKSLLQDILREELHYHGLITSDCMEMKAISENITTPVGVVKGIAAGIDLACVCHTKENQINSIEKLKHAVDEQIISIEDINKKVERILQVKNKVFSVMTNLFFKNIRCTLDIFNESSSSLINQKIVDASLTHVRGKKLELKGKILLFGCKAQASNMAEEINHEINIIDLVQKNCCSIHTIEYQRNTYYDTFITTSQTYDTVIFISYDAFTDTLQSKLINELNMKCSNFYVIAIRNPYDYLSLSGNINYYTLYEYTPSSIKSVIKFLKGEIDATGKLPIQLLK
ncbi:glycoside hydrolase family 3 protein [Piromyces finnis]|uniref:Glycoside hydrolase family 3 protein n=1 Tax=Piromyces finnis TaxID=1754191 RepID=A0A1Y1VLA4_9FUNG|nr:glycoside hydrolase family 3 protein [Piromyces finnis]|eukprot:ORX59230.1 glycoside hydrolase family 3 protein [Piromyces finnis]